MTTSVVIPTWNESQSIADCLAKLLKNHAPDEVIIVDGQSTDGTAEIAHSLGARVVIAPRGRGPQLDFGWRAATGTLILFLHVDTALDAGALSAASDLLSRRPRAPGGAFRLRIDHPDIRFRAIETAANLRAKLFSLPFGDQSIFARREALKAIGGVPPLHLLEDLSLARRLSRLGRLAVLPQSSVSSARRWLQFGVARQTVRNTLLVTSALLGANPNHLKRLYPDIRPVSASNRSQALNISAPSR